MVPCMLMVLQGRYIPSYLISQSAVLKQAGLRILTLTP